MSIIVRPPGATLIIFLGLLPLLPLNSLLWDKGKKGCAEEIWPNFFYFLVALLILLAIQGCVLTLLLVDNWAFFRIRLQSQDWRLCKYLLRVVVLLMLLLSFSWTLVGLVVFQDHGLRQYCNLSLIYGTPFWSLLLGTLGYHLGATLVATCLLALQIRWLLFQHSRPSANEGLVSLHISHVASK